MPRNTLDILSLSAVDHEDEILDCLVEVDLDTSKARDTFFMITETLTRVGVNPKNEGGEPKNVLYQTCHITQRGGKYYIVHFKHFYMFEGRRNGLCREDILRMNRIIRLLEQWGMIKIKHPEQITELAQLAHIKVVKHHDAVNWTLLPKYDVHKGNRQSSRRDK
ncbi:translation repressor [Serratia phage phiMAM1]|uniref:Translation repressor protein n=1 Tax=Serratia phage phiMAM1 TaxID=1262513 RepID=K7YGV0_9CAUD|nr:translation repressor [Serratia phage phiMAM1]AFX93549.1 RegA-translational repressor [Serratia phage phiMAM1]